MLRGATPQSTLHCGFDIYNYELGHGSAPDYTGVDIIKLGKLSSVKEKISIALSSEILAGVDHLADATGSRSALIEAILRLYFDELKGNEANARELKNINKAAKKLNAVADDVLSFQSAAFRSRVRGE